MADLERSGISDIVLKDSHLKQQWYAIQISEKRIQIKQLDVAFDRLQSVDMKKILHAKEKCKRELENLEHDIKNIIIDVNIVKKSK